MKMQQIYYVMEIARTGSINQAAKNLYVSQPHLSFTVAELERSLDISIFQRTSKGVELTGVGEEFVKACQHILDQLDYIESLYSFSEKESLTFILYSNCHNSVANAALIQLEKEYPDREVHFFLRTVSCLAMLRDIDERRCNLGLAVIPSMEMPSLRGLLKARRLQFQCLRQENACVVVGSENPLFSRKSLTLKECRNYPLVMLKDDWARVFGAVQAKLFRHRYTMDDKEGFFSTIADGDSIAIATPSINRLSSRVRSGEVRFIPLTDQEHLSYYIGWVSRRGYNPTDIEVRFLERYKELLEP